MLYSDIEYHKMSAFIPHILTFSGTILPVSKVHLETLLCVHNLEISDRKRVVMRSRPIKY